MITLQDVFCLSVCAAGEGGGSGDQQKEINLFTGCCDVLFFLIFEVFSSIIRSPSYIESFVRYTKIYTFFLVCLQTQF